MIKISKICDKNKNEFYDDVKKSYLDLLEKIKKDEKDTYNIKNRNKIIDYFYEGDKICENKVIEVITGDRKVLEKVIKEIGVLEKNKDGITLEELSEQKLILSHRYRSYLLSAFEKKGLLCDIYCECEDARTAMTLAEKGLGIAILPASMHKLSDQMQSCDILHADLATEILLAWRKGRMPEEVKAFLEMWN